ncbi:folate-binding protein [Citricoccus sp. SGAir0253]|uniref:CAF17-like 4Fe-4S cluster assembly/insertion protein YgfZ n=1 Tax=Citricoccus sp. SGAir0253 TaxID=2567881 RepID=UPI0010CD02B2|nr:folate-binding protein YgfZ [Citricoccus sp. SGAir0253]QCU77438.1 folate-binding protein [Citricoccus sp. SGAir0253]
MTSPLLSGPHAVHGAVAGSGPDAAVAAHYGQPVAEQRALAAGTAVVDLSHRGVVTVTGPDRLTWLHVLTSQRLDRLAPGTSTETLFLDVQGRIEFDCHLVDDGATTWLTVEPGEGAALADWLERMRFASRVEVADRTGEVAVLGATADVPGWDGRGDVVRWRDPWPAIGEGGFPYTEDPDPAHHPAADWSWSEYLVPAAELPGLPGALPAGWGLAGVLAAEALRIAALRPRHGVDTDDRTIPHEVDLVRTAVHLAKGCYKGQETIARVHNLGHPPRRLAFLQLDGSGHVLPAPGSDVVVRPETEAEAGTARPVGTLTSAALHHEMGPIALAVLKRATDPQAPLLVREGTAEDGWTLTAAAQETVVSPRAGKAVGRPTGLLRGGPR